MAKKLRVVQWTTGNIGSRALHGILTRDDMELVGVYAHSADKVGQDAGQLCGFDGETGVRATDDVEALLALEPDACSYNPVWSNTDELCRLLEAGVNVCSTAEWINGHRLPEAERQRVLDAAHRGKASMFGSGAYPGITHALGIVASAACERVDRITVTESVDCSLYASKDTMSAMGFGRPADTPGLEENLRKASEVCAEAAVMMADAVGARVDRMSFEATFIPAYADDDLGFMTIGKGTVGAIEGYHRAWSGDRNVTASGMRWTMGTHTEVPFKLAHGHVIAVEGSPNYRLVAQCLPPRGTVDYMGPGMIYTALPALNAVPAVVAAPPGIVTYNDLPYITGPVPA
ncbi:NAD(P)H-dependent amine dehydrogenase family protein [Sciscionella sediminilitoris]|uniref:NAD(P)H-dependent amine dehydrogenase family protein n=1 Tax=Sciscionella sediminilitoris TaxID=1445613 RepID=UPI0004DEF0F7|nr:dihydrodipicolinate reductase [Sciscionella sp. SE31]